MPRGQKQTADSVVMEERLVTCQHLQCRFVFKAMQPQGVAEVAVACPHCGKMTGGIFRCQ